MPPGGEPSARGLLSTDSYGILRPTETSIAPARQMPCSHGGQARCSPFERARCATFLFLRRAVLFLRRTPLQPGSAHAASQDHNGRPAQPDSAGSNCTWGERHHSQHAGCPRGREMGNGGREASTAQGRPQGREVQLRTGPVCLLALRKAQLPFQRTVWRFPGSAGVQMGPS